MGERGATKAFLDRNIRAFAVCSAILRDWNNAFYSAILIYTIYDTGLCGLEILEDTMVCVTQFSSMQVVSGILFARTTFIHICSNAARLKSSKRTCASVSIST
jgi:hypothetical protein